MGRRRGRNDEERRRDRNDEGSRPVEPEEARTHGNDPDAVEINRAGGGSGDGGTGRAEGGTEGSDVRRAEREGSGSGEGGPGGAYGGTEGNDARGAGRGGSSGSSRDRAAGARARSYEGQQQGGGPELVARRDSARWGPIWAGLVTAITTFLLLQLLALGLGILGIGPNATGGAWVSAIIGLIAFFTGGAVAGMTSAVRGAATGFLNGFLVWALGTVLILALSALGLGQVFGALGNLAGQLGPGALSGAAGNAPEVDPQQAADAVRNGALGAFFGLLVSAIAAALGGFLGARSNEPIGHMARDND